MRPVPSVESTLKVIDFKQETLIEVPKELYVLAFATGSNVICEPPVVDTDIDYMIYTEKMDVLIAYLIDNGWEKSNKIEYEQTTRPFISLRKENLNFILTNSLEHFTKFNTATKLAKKLNLLRKQQRIDLFAFIIEGKV